MKKTLFACLLFLLTTFLGFTKIDHFSKGMLLECRPEKTQKLFDFCLINEIAKKPVYYIGNGEEAIAFATSDDKYVLKFFLKRQILKKLFFKPKKKFKQVFLKDNEILTGFESLKKYEMALTALPDETGVLAVHAGESVEKLPICKLIDYRGKEHLVDLNRVAFVVQKKAKIINKRMLTESVNQQLQELFSGISGKGYISTSPTFNPENFAILDNKGVMIDVGKLEYVPDKAYGIEEEKFLKRYERWVSKKAG